MNLLSLEFGHFDLVNHILVIFVILPLKSQFVLGEVGDIRKTMSYYSLGRGSEGSVSVSFIEVTYLYICTLLRNEVELVEKLPCCFMTCNVSTCNVSRLDSRLSM